jgi:peptide chain release factor 1
MSNHSPNSNLLAKLDALAAEFDHLDRQLVDPEVVSDHQRVRALSIKRASIADLAERYRRYGSLQKQASEHAAIIREAGDRELVELARAELPELERESAALLEQITSDLVTADDRSVGSVILEVRAGTGGDEAGLWAGDIFDM